MQNYVVLGGYIDGQGGPPKDTNSHVFMVTNLCPAEVPNLDWCGQKGDKDLNKYGYHVHFDLENGAKQADNLGWNNPEVTYEIVDCDGKDSLTPSNAMFKTCYCGKNGT